MCIENLCSENMQEQLLISYLLAMLDSLRALEFSLMGQLRMLLVTGTHGMSVLMDSPHIPAVPPLLAKCQKMPGSYRGKDNRGWE